MAQQRKKLIYVTEPPDGLFYLPDFISEDEERNLTALSEQLEFEPYEHLGYKANREVVYFGVADGYNAGTTDGAKPFAPWLVPLRNRFAHLIGLEPDEIAMALVAQYKPGAGIGWHRDRPLFGPTVFGISLASDAEMRFRRFVGSTEEMFKIILARRSGYLISDQARSMWQHGMNPVKSLRYSLTFRTLRNRKSDVDDPRHSAERIHQKLIAVGYTHPTPPIAKAGEQPVQLGLFDKAFE